MSRLAAVAGRKSLCSAASLSRLLGRVTAAEVGAVKRWLLWTLPNIKEVLQHPSVLVWDSQGRAWHVFDLDGSMTVLRHRALAMYADLPEGKRRSERLVAPGYPGRKRGDAQFCRCALQHAGAGLWIDMLLGPGNGDHRAEVAYAGSAIVDLLLSIGANPSQGMLRLDGGYIGVPTVATLRELGVAFVTRWKHPLLGHEAIEERIRTATWTFVPDSGSGPRRSAAELGNVTLYPDRSTPGPDGHRAFEPQTVRAVISRYPAAAKTGAGTFINGWHYEIFIVDASIEAWPAAEAVALYHGRASIENRFAQEDRELTLDRIFSYEPAGQELATVVGLAAWNYETVRGFQLDVPPAQMGPAAPRGVEADLRPVEWPNAEPEPVAADASTPELPKAEEPEATAHAPSPARELPAEVTETLDLLRVALRDSGVEASIKDRPGWTYSPEEMRLKCPDGQLLHLRCVTVTPDRGQLVFAAKEHTCDECPLRSGCMSSSSKRKNKQTHVTVDKEIAPKIKELLGKLPKEGRSRLVSPATLSVEPRRERRRTPTPAGFTPPPPHEPKANALACVYPTFLAGEARGAWRRLTAEITGQVVVGDVPPEPRRHRYIGNAEVRQRRRQTWTTRQQRYALPDGTKVELTLVGQQSLITKLVGRRVRPPRRDQPPKANRVPRI